MEKRKLLTKNDFLAEISLLMTNGDEKFDYFINLLLISHGQKITKLEEKEALNYIKTVLEKEFIIDSKVLKKENFVKWVFEDSPMFDGTFEKGTKVQTENINKIVQVKNIGIGENRSPITRNGVYPKQPVILINDIPYAFPGTIAKQILDNGILERLIKMFEETVEISKIAFPENFEKGN